MLVSLLRSKLLRIVLPALLVCVWTASAHAAGWGGCTCNNHWHGLVRADEDGSKSFSSGSISSTCAHYGKASQTKSGSISGGSGHGDYDLTCSARTYYTCEHYTQFTNPYGYGSTEIGYRRGFRQETLEWHQEYVAHSAPTNGTWAYAALADVCIGLTWDSDNHDATTTGSCYSYGYAMAEITGIGSDDCELQLGGTAAESLQYVAVSVPEDFGGQIAIINGYATYDIAGYASVSGLANPAVAGQELKLRGEVKGRSQVSMFAELATASATTDISTSYGFNCYIQYGGTHPNCKWSPLYVHPEQ